MFDRKGKVKNFAVLDMWSATHLEAFLIKQGMLFLEACGWDCMAHMSNPDLSVPMLS